MGITLNKSNIMGIGIVGTLVLIILASGCISSPTTDTKTFSDGAMSFNYPSDFDNGTYSADDTNSSFPMQVIGNLENTDPLRLHNILVCKNISPTTPAEIRDRSISRAKNESTGKILSMTTETNPNDIVVEKTIYSFEYSLGMRGIYSEMYFKIKDTVYAISIYGPDTSTSAQNIRDTTNIVFQSIK